APLRERRVRPGLGGPRPHWRPGHHQQDPRRPLGRDPRLHPQGRAGRPRDGGRHPVRGPHFGQRGQRMTTRTFDITQALERQKLSGFGLGLVMISWLVTFFDGYDMLVISFTAKRLMGQFHLTRPEYSYIYSSAVVGTILGGFLFGYIGDR